MRAAGRLARTLERARRPPRASLGHPPRSPRGCHLEWLSGPAQRRQLAWSRYGPLVPDRDDLAGAQRAGSRGLSSGRGVRRAPAPGGRLARSRVRASPPAARRRGHLDLAPVGRIGSTRAAAAVPGQRATRGDNRGESGGGARARRGEVASPARESARACPLRACEVISIWHKCAVSAPRELPPLCRDREPLEVTTAGRSGGVLDRARGKLGLDANLRGRPNWRLSPR